MIRKSNLKELTLTDLNTFLDYSFVDWSKEPQDTFSDLCKQRAQQIRDNHDYVILYHSGGSDSTTVLNHFKNIYVDEIVTVSFGLNYPCLDGKKAEYDVSVKDRKEYGYYNQIKITFDQIMNFIKNDQWVFEKSPNFTGNIHSIARFNVNYLEAFGFSKPRQRFGKIAHVTGVHDPNVKKETDGYYAYMYIKPFFNPSGHHENTAFFTSKDFPELHVKQCYIVAKAMEKYPTINRLSLKNLVRDFYSPIISPTKPGGDSNFIIKNRDKYSEMGILLDNYAKEKEFSQCYSAQLRPYISYSTELNTVSPKLVRKYKLF